MAAQKQHLGNLIFWSIARNSLKIALRHQSSEVPHKSYIKNPGGPNCYQFSSTRRKINAFFIFPLVPINVKFQSFC